MVDVVAEATHQQKQRHLLQKAKLRSLSQSRLHYKPYQVHNYFCSWILVISKERLHDIWYTNDIWYTLTFGTL